MWRRALYSFIVTLLFLSASTPARAQQDHHAYYEAYQQAMHIGEYADAERHAEDAWRAAERELGDSETTAILAYNFAALIYDRRPADAIAPLQRVIDLTGEANEMFGPEAPIIMLLYIEAGLDNDSRSRKRALRKKLEEREESGVGLNLLTARAWLQIASFDILRRRYERGKISSDHSVRHYVQFQNRLPKEAANAYLLAGVARIAGRSRENRDIADAAKLLNKAIRLYPPQDSIETFDPTLAITLAWRTALDSAAYSDNPEFEETGAYLFSMLARLEPAPGVKWTAQEDGPMNCIFDWDKGEKPPYPRTEAIKRNLGGVVIGFRIEGLNVTNAWVLAEVPARSRYGEATLKYVRNWKLRRPVHRACGDNLIMTMRYVLLPG